MANALIDLSGWDWGSKLLLLSALAQSVDEFQGLVAEARILVTDPDLPDKQASAHKMVDFAFAIAANFANDPQPVQALAATMPAAPNRQVALALTRQYVPWDKVGEAFVWLLDHLDELAQYILPWLPLIFSKAGEKASALRLPRLRAA